jgi:hypothetical protein
MQLSRLHRAGSAAETNHERIDRSVADQRHASCTSPRAGCQYRADARHAIDDSRSRRRAPERRNYGPSTRLSASRRILAHGIIAIWKVSSSTALADSRGDVNAHRKHIRAPYCSRRTECVGRRLMRRFMNARVLSTAASRSSSPRNERNVLFRGKTVRSSRTRQIF